MADGIELLFSAIQDESIADVMRQLDSGKSSVNQRDMDQYGQTPLHIAATKGNMEMVKMLVEKYSANYDLEDMFGEVPVHKAADAGHISVVSYLLSKKCKYSEDVQHLVESTGDTAEDKHGDNQRGETKETTDKLPIDNQIGECKETSDKLPINNQMCEGSPSIKISNPDYEQAKDKSI